ncbi:MAG: ABC transporter substrate-binding protein [Parcubacteria group bacterium]|nr:ABC transporter substrate-binding protein [Parcubacteria group bacterium]
MKFRKCFKHALNMVLHSKLRSWLTIIGIIIGVAAVIAIVSIGEGMQQSIEQQMGSLGGDILTISAGYSRGGSMFGRGRMRGGSTQATGKEVIMGRADLQALKGLADIALIDINIRGQVDISYQGKSGSLSLTGVDQKVWADITTEEIKEGRMLGSADQNVVIIGGTLADSFFSKPVGINKMLTIQNKAFRVVGILDGNSRNIYMPLQMAYQILENKQNGIYDSIIVKVKDEERLDNTIAKIESKLMLVRHVTEKKKDFTISSSKKIMETRSEMMGSINAFLLAIAAVSLIVGAVGIANTMFTSVLEKTKEIGIMKAIGARNKDILTIFLMNSIIIGLVGGLLGVLLGTILSESMAALIGDVRFMRGGTIVTLNSVLMALSVSVTVGILAGFIPARKASKLKPVDALRHD